MAKDFYHELVKEALEAERWTITHAPYSMNDWVQGWEADFGAEKDTQKIVVDVHPFTQKSADDEFHDAMGKYMNYSMALENIEHSRVSYMAVPIDIWQTTFQKSGIRNSLIKYHVRLFIYDPTKRKIAKWLSM